MLQCETSRMREGLKHHQAWCRARGGDLRVVSGDRLQGWRRDIAGNNPNPSFDPRRQPDITASNTMSLYITAVTVRGQVRIAGGVALRKYDMNFFDALQLGRIWWPADEALFKDYEPLLSKKFRYSIDNGPFFQLGGLVVKPEFQRRGIGKRLVRAARWAGFLTWPDCEFQIGLEQPEMAETDGKMPKEVYGYERMEKLAENLDVLPGKPLYLTHITRQEALRNLLWNELEWPVAQSGSPHKAGSDRQGQ